MRFTKLIIPMGIMASQIACSKGEKNAESPNIVIILIDDMGFGDLGCYGNPLLKTPNIDRLAEEGIRFTSFYVNSPISSPSRVALNTGKYPMKYAIHSALGGLDGIKARHMNSFLDSTATTLARTLKDHGYVTGHFGKWHMGGGRDVGDAPPPSTYGFDKSFVNCEGMGDRLLYYNEKPSLQSAKLGKGKIVWSEMHHSTSIYIDSALAFIRRYPNKPFYINLCPSDVHDPHLPDSNKLEAFRNLSPNPYEQAFLAVLDELDKQIGRFIKALDDLDLLQNTIIIFTSDNGPTDWPWYYRPEEYKAEYQQALYPPYPENYHGPFYPPGFTGQLFGRKWSLYEGGIRVPFIIRWPSKIPKGLTDSLTLLVEFDIFPSLCSMINIPVPEDLDGTNKSKALLGKPIKRSPAVMWEYASNKGGNIMPGNPDYISPTLVIRENQWKLGINTDSTDIQIYNLTEDPGETKNLVNKEKKVAQKLASKVLNWRRSLPVPLKK